MAGFIKSHSNYRLQTRHQTVDGGIILERDISTVGGANTFATGQATVYQSGNFVMVVNNGSPVARHVRKGSWLSAFDGSDTWDAQAISLHESDVRGSVERKIMLKNDFMDLRSFAYYGSLSDLVENTVCTIMRDFPYEIYLGDSTSGISATTLEAYNPGGIDIIKKYDPSTEENSALGHFFNEGYLNYEVYEEGYSGNPCPITSWTVNEGYSGHCEAYSTASGASFPIAATVEIGYQKGNETSGNTTIYVFYNRDGSIYYNWKPAGSTQPIHIRPKDSLGFYDTFTDNLDMFGKCLIGVYSGTRNVSKFEVLDTERYGNGKTVRTFTFPSGEGGYNIATHGMALERYIGDLGKIAMSYDEYYTDNMYRMMTHESLKNLDWTRGFNGEEDESQYVKTGEKFAAVIRIMGYVFDHEKAYIDSIGNVNTITYSDRSNLSDYFLSDSLEQDGWIVNTIYPYKLTLKNNNGEDVTDGANYTVSGQTSGLYSRSFSEITDLGYDIVPYSYTDKAYYYSCDSENPAMTGHEIVGYSGQTYQVVSGNVYNVITNYSSTDAVTIPDINNEFEKRLRINSRSILRKKGTIDSIESLLSVFGMRSKKWVESHKMSSSGITGPDFDIEEFTTISPYIVDSGDTVHENMIDWYNSCKTIPYYTGGRPSVEYIPYQGLPVAYRESSNGRRLYPYFDGQGVYDGGMYYQMNGGWLRYMPYRFGTDEEMLSGSTDNVESNNIETMRDVMLVSNIEELVGQPRQNLYSGMVCYVNSTGGEFAIINGYVYPLKTDASDKKYFVVNVYGSSVSVGGDLYENTIRVSDGTSPSGTTYYDLGLYEDGYPIRIYYTEDRSDAFTIIEYLYEDPQNPYEKMPESALVFLEGNYDGGTDNTNYFQLVDIDGYGKIGDYYWRQVKKTEELYRKVDSITDKYTGNNPHFGKFSYDNGQEYIDRFKKLFKYPLENNLFNTSCFPEIGETLEAIEKVGFDVYDGLISDTKSHSFADTYNSGGTLSVYDMEEFSSLSGRAQEYSTAASGGTFDGVTSQVINTKNIRITFYIDSTDDCYTKEAQEQIKYIQCKVMPYVEQLIPSTAIAEIRFLVKN